MRARRSKDVNIFSASVVDLFASGLGVFLIVAIIALVNQKKNDYESPKKVKVETTPSVAKTPNVKLKVGAPPAEIRKLKDKIAGLNEEVIQARAKLEKFKLESSAKSKALGYGLVNNKTTEDKERLEKRIKGEQQKAVELDTENRRLSQELKKMRLAFDNLKKNYQSKTETTNKLKTGSQFDLKLGTKVKLQNVHFYAGTDKLIEPYGTEEIKELATKLLERPNVKIEVSGHIFLTKKEITKGQGYDESNLSGQRAGIVCDKLIEMGIKENRLRCVGYGGKRYLYLTDDQYSKEAQLNRRVEIEVTAD